MWSSKTIIICLYLTSMNNMNTFLPPPLSHSPFWYQFVSPSLFPAVSFWQVFVAGQKTLFPAGRVVPLLWLSLLKTTRFYIRDDVFSLFLLRGGPRVNRARSAPLMRYHLHMLALVVNLVWHQVMAALRKGKKVSCKNLLLSLYEHSDSVKRVEILGQCWAG